MLPILAHTLLSLITLHIQKKDKAVAKRRLKMERAKAADGYLPKWRSNHLPRQRRGGEREREKKKTQNIISILMKLQCSAAIQQQTGVLQLVLLNRKVRKTFSSSHIIPIFKQLILRK